MLANELNLPRRARSFMRFAVQIVDIYKTPKLIVVPAGHKDVHKVIRPCSRKKRWLTIWSRISRDLLERKQRIWGVPCKTARLL